MLKKTEIVNKVSRAAHKVGFKLKKHSPEILVVSGVVGMVTATVVACKATTKLDQILAEGKEKEEAIKAYNPDELKPSDTEETEVVEYTEEDRNKDLFIVKVQTCAKVVKLYAPAVALGVVSATAILAGHNITRKRNVALSAAFTAVTNDFKTYRKRLIDRFGEELDKEIRFNIKNKEVEETTVNEDGSESTVKKIVPVMESDPNKYSVYSIIYDDGCTGWTKDPESNKKFLIMQQNYANEKLKRKGYLFLNEVYEALGVPRTKAGQVVGWVYDEKNPIGDNYVDFGIFDIHNANSSNFLKGYERNIVLDFNVDGDILNYM